MSVTQKQLREHFLKLGSGGAIYVWGANVEKIDSKLMDRLYKTYGSLKYNKKYYDNKLAEGKGKIGADCSGSLFPVSGIDRTAAGYYSACTKKGTIKTLPENKVCLVFKKNALGRIVHVGCYTGDGYVSEMASSALNYQRKKLSGNGWSVWGIPDFISNPHETFTLKENTTTTKASDTKMKQIKLGSKGKAVLVWQSIVMTNKEDIDGEFGEKTRKATIEFQKKVFPNDKSEHDGIVGEKTWRAGLESV